MITVIDGDSSTFTAMAYGMPDPVSIQWCHNRAMQARQMLAPEARAIFENTTNEVFGEIDHVKIARIAKAAKGRLDSIWQTDTISTLTTVQAIQNAPPTMITFIMANPMIREMYHEQKIAGFDDYYHDNYPTDHSYQFKLYREVVDGVFLETGNKDEMVAVEWVGEFDDSTLDLIDKQSIMETWDNVLAHVRKGGEDPTSIYNAML